MIVELFTLYSTNSWRQISLYNSTPIPGQYMYIDHFGVTEIVVTSCTYSYPDSFDHRKVNEKSKTRFTFLHLQRLANIHKSFRS